MAIEPLNAEQAIPSSEECLLELYNKGFGVEITPDDFDVFQKLAQEGKVPEDWYRKNYGMREDWLRRQREAGFVE